ncbi:MAG: right-handed parallel beta-helix repeat-containing protein [Phycisphaeraceae bacterium]|nr:right-handed parallel beta-helix repeat-containing protein [Phycisphaeraceae bacterium]
MKHPIAIICLVFSTLCINCSAEMRTVPAEYGSVQSAIDACTEGDTVVVSPGTYVENIRFKGIDITLTSTNPNDPKVVAATILNGENGLVTGRSQHEEPCSTVVFEKGETTQTLITGFTIMGGQGLFQASNGFFWGAGIFCMESSPTIQGNVIRHNTGPTGWSETENVGYGGGIACYNANPVIAGNSIWENQASVGGGILVYGGEPLITNNWIHHNGSVYGGGCLLFSGRLINNTLVENSANLGPTRLGGNLYLVFDPSFGSLDVRNNILCNAMSGGGLFWEGEPGQDDWMQYNNVWGNLPGDYVSIDITGQTTAQGPHVKTGLFGNISVDPQFVNPNQQDYHLLPDSPCVDAGDPAFEPYEGQTDIDGDRNVHRLWVDMGADECTDCLSPAAYAGADQALGRVDECQLDGRGSLFCVPDSETQFLWTQTEGPIVVLVDPTSPMPWFVPQGEGQYIFELIVAEDGILSEPDEVTIVLENHSPVAQAGPDQTLATLPDLIILDGGDSMDMDGDVITYHWQQIAGPQVNLIDAHLARTEFVPQEMGVYTFILTVHDGSEQSLPDTVGIVIGNQAPVADAGTSRYASKDPVTLDGSESFDLDGYGELRYSWKQVSGPDLILSDPTGALLTVSGFQGTSRAQHCTFELTVSDGLIQSGPVATEIIIVPQFGPLAFTLIRGPFDPNKPTIVAFGGGNCNTGGGLQLSDQWHELANFLTVPSYDKPYSRYGDVLIAYLSSVAPDYDQPIGTMGFSTGNMPAIDVAIQVNKTYQDRRFAVNRVTFLDTACRSYNANIKEFYDTRLEGEAFWIDNYYSTMGSMFKNVLNIRFPAPPAEHGTPVSWVRNSATMGERLEAGLNAGFFVSVAGPGRHLQIPEDMSPYWFAWNPDTDTLVHHDETRYPGHILQPVRLVGPDDGDWMDADGVVLTCEPDSDAIQYDLLLGPDPQHLIHLVSQTHTPPAQSIQTLPYGKTYWTIRTTDIFGSTTYPEPVCVWGERDTQKNIKNLVSHKQYWSIQEAINHAHVGDVIMVGPGTYAYGEQLNFHGKAITVRSLDPNNPEIVARTVINAGLNRPVAIFSTQEGPSSVLSGLTLINGTQGILCDKASPTITHCLIQVNLGAGILLRNESRPLIQHCRILQNGGAGIELETITTPRRAYQNYPTITDCLITGNQGGGIVGDTPTIIDSIVEDNGG